MQNSMTSTTALNIAVGVIDGLAVLAGEHLGQRIHIAVHEIDEAHQDPNALLGVGGSPSRLRRLGVRDRLADVGGGGERHARLHGTGARIEHVAEASGVRSDERSAQRICGMVRVILRCPFTSSLA